jgi:hypothetical protein
VRASYKEGYADGTRKLYGRAMAQYITFATGHGLSSTLEVRAPLEEDVMFFVAWLHTTKGQNPATVRTTLSGLANELAALRMPDPMKHGDGTVRYRLHRMLRGMKRKFTVKKRVRLALTTDKLLPVVKWLSGENAHLPTLDAVTVKCCLVMGVFFMLRVSELVAESAVKHTFLNACMGDVKILPSWDDPQFVEFTVRNSKQDYFRQGCVLKVAANGTSICPVAAVMALMRARPGARPDEPLFVLTNGKFLDRARMQVEMRRALEAVGFKGEDYATHSMRAGGATSLFCCEGFDGDMVRVLGRWASDSYRLYLRHTDRMRRDASLAMANIATKKWSELDRTSFSPDKIG